jgi:hypothetical protein
VLFNCKREDGGDMGSITNGSGAGERIRKQKGIMNAAKAGLLIVGCVCRNTAVSWINQSTRTTKTVIVIINQSQAHYL